MAKEWFIKQELRSSTNHKRKAKFTYIKINNLWPTKDTKTGLKGQETQYENVTA